MPAISQRLVRGALLMLFAGSFAVAGAQDADSTQRFAQQAQKKKRRQRSEK